MKGWMRIGVRASFICCRYVRTQPVRSNVSLRFGSGFFFYPPNPLAWELKSEKIILLCVYFVHSGCARSRVVGVISLGFQTRGGYPVHFLVCGSCFVSQTCFGSMCFQGGNPGLLSSSCWIMVFTSTAANFLWLV